MADEARAMLDALMGADRNTALPPGTAGGSDGAGGGSAPTMSRRKRSCYDHNICPLYCAWNGTDVHELFTNTKSDIGPNPRLCDDHAREEYAALPDSEKDRLGFERMLYDRLRDLVRGCDRTVQRNMEKLRQELVRGQRARGGRGDGDDPAANISEEKVLQVAEDMARLDLLEEEIAGFVKELEELDGEESDIVAAAATSGPPPRTSTASAETTDTSHAENGDSKKNNGEAEQDKADSDAKSDADANEEKDGDKKDADRGDENTPVKEEEASAKEQPEPESSLDEETKSKLKDIRSKKRTVLSELTSKIERLAPLREGIEAETRRLHYFRSDTTIDKCVCEVSGNFMSYRDADERIAAHYAGKQYVGWKMVRDKHAELKKKYGNMPGGPPRGGGPPRPYDRRGGPPQSYGPPPERGGGYGGGGGGGRDYRRGGGGYGGGGGGGHRRDDRSRSRDHDRSRGRRRSPDRWERDRGPRGHRGHGGGGGGGHGSRW